MTTPRWSWAEVCARRLDRHALATPARDARPADVVGAVCAVHAQVLPAAEVSVGLRLAGATLADVRHALWTEHSLVKTFGPRATVHLVAAGDLPMWTGALAAAPQPPRSDSQPERARMTPEQAEEVVAAIAVALADAELTVDELGEAVVAATGPWAGDLVMEAWQGRWPRWRQALPLAGLRGALCFGPNRGRKVTYTNPRRWLPGFRPADGPSALADVVRRYLHAYGPATPQQLAQWLAWPPARGWWPGMPWRRRRHRRACGCCPTSTPTRSAAIRGSCCSPGRRPTAPLAAARPGTSRCCWSTGPSPGSGTSAVPAAASTSPWSRSSRSARRQQLDDQVRRLGEFLDRRPRLTIGAVTTGGHA
jgi:winged helix DNA-binding protein